MKKVILIMMTFLLTVGCEKKFVEEKKDTNSNEEQTIVKIDEEEFKLNRQNNLKDMYYNENYVDFHTDAIGKIRTMNYLKNGEFIFEIRLSYDDEHSFDEVTSLIAHSPILKKVNDIEYKYYEYLNDANDNVHLYLYNYKNVTYTILFIFKSDISDLENKFMNNVKFK